MIAYVNYLAYNFLEAEDFYQKGIKKAKNDNNNYWEALTTRSYANFLFNTWRSTEGRKQYEITVNLLQNLFIKGNSDLIPSTVGYIYQQQVINELFIGEINNVEKYFNKVEREFNKIEYSFAKNTYLNSLNDLKTRNLIK